MTFPLPMAMHQDLHHLGVVCAGRLPRTGGRPYTLAKGGININYDKVACSPNGLSCHLGTKTMTFIESRARALLLSSVKVSIRFLSVKIQRETQLDTKTQSLAKFFELVDSLSNNITKNIYAYYSKRRILLRLELPTNIQCSLSVYEDSEKYGANPNREEKNLLDNSPHEVSLSPSPFSSHVKKKKRNVFLLFMPSKMRERRKQKRRFFFFRRKTEYYYYALLRVSKKSVDKL